MTSEPMTWEQLELWTMADEIPNDDETGDDDDDD